MSWLFFSVSPSELRAIVLLTIYEYHLESLASPEIYDLVSVWCDLSGIIQFFTLVWKALPWETCTECMQGSRNNLCPPLGLFPNPHTSPPPCLRQVPQRGLHWFPWAHQSSSGYPDRNFIILILRGHSKVPCLLFTCVTESQRGNASQEKILHHPFTQQLILPI